jgi:hypothetical protein
LPCRYFILWYQILGDNAPEHIHRLFTCLVPGFPPRQPSPYKSERKINGKRHMKSASCDEKDKDFYDAQPSQYLLYDVGVTQGPITQVESGPVLPPQSGEKPLDNESVKFLEALLEFMVTQVCVCLPSICVVIIICEN